MEERPGNGVLVDTGVWVDFFKAGSEMGDRLEGLISEGSVWVCGIVLFELLQGVRSADERDRILATLSSLHYVEMSLSLWQQAADISSSLKKAGLNLPISDILIAAVALEHRLTVFTLDSHFQQIPGLKTY